LPALIDCRVDFDSVVAAIDPKQTGVFDRDHVIEVLKAAKWLLLLFLLCEAAALVLSILLRFVLAPPNAATAYDNFDEVCDPLKPRHSCTTRASAATLVRHSVESGSTGIFYGGAECGKCTTLTAPTSTLMLTKT
jgi:hypothetical protein